MTQRFKQSSAIVNLESTACEKYMTRLLQRELKEKPASPFSGNTNRIAKHSSLISNQLNAIKPNVKQHNLSPSRTHQSPTRNVLECGDEALVEVTVKAKNPRHRSRSITADREPWGQVLKQQKSSDKISVFGSFDPLRTLHFLAKELHYHLQAVLPEDTNVQQMVTDIQHALKRVPPEVASSVHLQQTIDLLPSKNDSKTVCPTPSQLKRPIATKNTQTPPSMNEEDNEKLRKLMEESTLKLEDSCKQMELVCSRLKTENENLQKQLQVERSTAEFFKKRIEDMEKERDTLLNPRVASLELKNQQLETDLAVCKTRFNTQSAVSNNEFKSQLAELKRTNCALEQECGSLKHQLILAGVEKEKFVAVLGLRDRQVNEIRKEMKLLQEIINEQLSDLHKSSVKSMPSSGYVNALPSRVFINENKENAGDATLSTIYSNDDQIQQFLAPSSNPSIRDLPSGDDDVSHFQDNHCYRNRDVSKDTDLDLHVNKLDKLDSHSSIRNMFNEIKKTAYAVASTPRLRSQMNLVDVNKSENV